MQKIYSSKHIPSGSATTTLVPRSAYVTSIVYNCAAAGGTLKIQDRSSPPKILIGPFTIIIPTDGKPTVLFEMGNDRVRMDGGVDAVTDSITGVLDIWTTGNMTEETT